MKTLVLTIIIIILSISIIKVSAQNSAKMTIHKTDKTAVTYNLSDIDSITFTPCQTGKIWTTEANMPDINCAMGIAVLNNKLYTFGGNPTSSSVTDKTLEYDILNKAWTTKTPDPQARSFAGTAVIDNKIYVFGGSALSTCFDLVEVYDPQTDTWTTKSPMPYVNSNFGTAVYNNNIYVFGGNNCHGTSYQNILEYNTSTDSWSVVGQLSKQRVACISATVNGKIFIFGGYDGDNLVEEYDPTNKTILTKTSMPHGRHRISSTAPVVNNKVYLIGGLDINNKTLNINEEYDPSTDSWKTKSSKPEAEADLGFGIFDNKIFVFGGQFYPDNVMTNIYEIYDPSIDY